MSTCQAIASFERFAATALVLLFRLTAAAARSASILERRAGQNRPSSTSSRKSPKNGSPDFVPPAERIATFDNDGTLWAEQPMYFQLLFALDRVKALAPQHPEWKDKEPFASLLKGDVKARSRAASRPLPRSSWPRTPA